MQGLPDKLPVGITLRPLAAGDVEPVKALIRAVWRAEFGTHPLALVRDYMEQPEVLADIGPAHYAPPHGTFLVAEAADGAAAGGAVGPRHIVACAGVERVGAPLGTPSRGSTHDKALCELKRMYVAPSHRRQGLASALCGELVRFARAAGYRHMRLSSNKALVASHRLYTAMGFRAAASWDHEAAEHVLFFERALQ